MKNNLLLSTLCILLSGVLSAQNASRKIEGTITEKNAVPLAGVNIMLEDSYDGATSDSSGHFSFTTTDEGTILSFEKEDYALVVREISPSGNASLKVSMKKMFTELDAVTISAGVLTQKSISVLNPIDIVTVAGGAGDVSGALKTLPGTQQINDREGLFVRGGSGDETQQFIDGAMVRNAFLTGLPNLGSRGRFSPFLFKGTVFSPGGYSALYGGALSGAVLLESIDLPQRTSASLNLSALGLGGGYQHLSKDQKFSIGGSYNYTDLGLYFKIVPQLVDYSQSPIFHNIDFNFRKKIGKGILKFYTAGSMSDVAIFRPYLDSYSDSLGSYEYKTGTQLQNQNFYSNLSYSSYFDNDWMLDAVVSYSTNEDRFGIHPTPYSQSSLGEIQQEVLNQNHFGTARMQARKSFTPKFDLVFGAETQISDEANTFTIHTPASSFTSSLRDIYSAAFAEGEFYINKDLGFKAGLRYEYSDYLNKSNLAPRLSVAYRMGKVGEFSAAYGHFYQKPLPQFLYYTSDLDFQKATHYILTYTKSMKDRLIRVETFQKDYQDLISYTSNMYGFQFYPTAVSQLGQEGDGYARGIELYFRDKKTFKGIDYWISYSYLNTKRKYLNYPIETQPDFAANHVAALVVKKFWSKINFGVNASYNFSTGRPYFDPNTSLDAQGDIIPDNFMSGRSPTYGSLSLSANYLRQFGKVFSVFVLSISNVLNQNQIYGYNFASTPNSSGDYISTPVYPGARQFIFLGAFFSLGIDRSQEAINNNL